LAKIFSKFNGEHYFVLFGVKKLFLIIE